MQCIYSLEFLRTFYICKKYTQELKISIKNEIINEKIFDYSLIIILLFFFVALAILKCIPTSNASILVQIHKIKLLDDKILHAFEFFSLHFHCVYLLKILARKMSQKVKKKPIYFVFLILGIFFSQSP